VTEKTLLAPQSPFFRAHFPVLQEGVSVDSFAYLFAELSRVPTFKLSQFDQTDVSGKYALMVTDLDAPSQLNPAFREFRIYLGVNCTITNDGYISTRDENFLCLSQWPKMADVRAEMFRELETAYLT
jgi:hypothetical protein